MFNKDLKLLLMLGNRFFIDPPSSYTTNYNLKKYLDGDDPGAAALNEDKDIIDGAIFSSSINNIVASIPLIKTGSNLELQWNTNNIKLTSNRLNTIQNIGTGSSPQFSSVYVNDNFVGGTDPDSSVFYFTGSTYQKGVIYLEGDINIITGSFGGASLKVTANTTITGSLKTLGTNYFRGNTNQTGSLYVSASLVSRKLVVNPSATSSGYIGSITGSQDDYFGSIGLPPGYDALISGSLLLTGNTTITGSLTANATSQFKNGLNIYGTTSLYDFAFISNSMDVIGQARFSQAVWITKTPAGHTEALYVDGDTKISNGLIVTGSTQLQIISSSGYSVSRHLGTYTADPAVTIHEGDTYWNSNTSRGLMYLGGSWRQITA